MVGSTPFGEGDARRGVDIDDGERHPARAVGISIAAAVGGFLFGFDTSVINGAVDSIRTHFGLGSGITGFVVAIALIGSAVGAPGTPGC